MEPLYYQTPYVKEFDAIVTACRPAKHGFEVELSQTGFYPEGGGQPYDTGILGGAHVTDRGSARDTCGGETWRGCS